jgi:hypothetical protein
MSDQLGDRVGAWTPTRTENLNPTGRSGHTLGGRMSRRWVPGAGWVASPEGRLCPCGAPVKARVGKGAPFEHCEAHIPLSTRWMASQSDEYRAERREYFRRRFGYRPRRDFVCRACQQPARGYTDDLCTRCRARLRRKKPPAICGCGVTFERRSPTQRYHAPECKPKRVHVGHESAAYQRELARHRDEAPM